MITKAYSFIDAARAKARTGRIPVFYSTQPRPCLRMKVLAVLIAAAMTGTVLSASVAHAETAALQSDAPVLLAQQAPPSGSGDRPDRPPREAMEACSDQPAESACAFSDRDGQQVQGTCRSPDAEAPAACIPADMPMNG